MQVAQPVKPLATPAPIMANRKALVIGNDSYRHVPKLFNARADAVAIGQALSELGYKVTTRQDLSEKEMKSAIRQFRNEVEGGDELMIFFSLATACSWGRRITCSPPTSRVKARNRFAMKQSSCSGCSMA